MRKKEPIIVLSQHQLVVRNGSRGIVAVASSHLQGREDKDGWMNCMFLEDLGSEKIKNTWALD